MRPKPGINLTLFTIWADGTVDAWSKEEKMERAVLMKLIAELASVAAEQDAEKLRALAQRYRELAEEWRKEDDEFAMAMVTAGRR